MSKTKLRIVKVYLGNTIIYVPEVYKLKTHWFSESTWEWERFFFDRYGDYNNYYHLGSEKVKLRNIDLAKEWIKMYTDRYLDDPVVWANEVVNED